MDRTDLFGLGVIFSIPFLILLLGWVWAKYKLNACLWVLVLSLIAIFFVADRLTYIPLYKNAVEEQKILADKYENYYREKFEQELNWYKREYEKVKDFFKRYPRALKYLKGAR